MRQIAIPSLFREVLGESQTLAEIVAILLFSVGLTVLLCFLSPEALFRVDAWRSTLAILLILDIFAGCIANFSYSTNHYYAQHSTARLVFIAIHVHLLAIALLLDVAIDHAMLVWAYTMLAALAVNALKGMRLQRFAAGLLLALGVAMVFLAPPAPQFFMLISVLFMLKVMYSFAVDHYAQRDWSRS
ncbi:hypothetical protein FNU76_06055 [Chitinimonas arctica]|uniref:Uncharacterized protein n=1 Tax=Chitinimonas arctica TaxID=2594795 RepID=A0A516SCT1_9NEIS|nr:hypothetical protein [Chitinimonas arctica]QDQ25951.1 hypothetical protein FNU76_06055 [Chitinimonas arctica]